MANPEDCKKKAHDITVIKRSTANQLRNDTPKGRKVMLIWDKACIDCRLWCKFKHSYSIYSKTLEKTNSTAENYSTDRLDRSDPRNQGVLSDHLVAISNCFILHRIVYINPKNSVRHNYLIPPTYQIVLLYKHRWDIEKIFHQFKSEMIYHKISGKAH